MRVTERLLHKAVDDHLTPREFDVLSNRAGGWAFCAIGENRTALKKRGFHVEKDGGPSHPFLVHLGSRFAGLVNQGYFRKALRLYTRIKRIAIGEIKVKGGIY